MNSRSNRRTCVDDEAPPTVRTYRSKRACWVDERQRNSLKSCPSGTAHDKYNAMPGMRGLGFGGLQAADGPSTTVEKSSRRRSFMKDSCYFPPSADGIEDLIRQAEVGGDRGRASAFALAKACKFSEIRKPLGRQIKVLDDLARVLSASIKGKHGLRDEALVHCLTVAVFILSKDASVAKGFSASMVSTLSSLIEDKHGTSKEKRDCTPSLEPSGIATWINLGEQELSRPGKHTKLLDSAVGVRQHEISPLQSSKLEEGRSVFSLSSDEEPLDTASCVRRETSEVEIGGKGMPNKSQFDGSSVAVCSTLSKRTLPSPKQLSAVPGQGSADALARARMLLDISDMIPWGMANRHLVSASDLGLTALVNVAAQACTDGGDNGWGTGGESLGDDPSTQDSGTSLSDPSQPESTYSMDALTADSTDEEARSNAGVMEELSRLGISGFLPTIIMKGGATLKALSSSNEGSGGVDPSSLRELHRLSQGLRLLDLATLNSSTDRTAEVAESASTARHNGRVKLVGAVLRVVSRCQVILGDADGPKSSRGSPIAAVRRVGGRKVRYMKQRSHRLGDEVASRVQECLLAALRVLINITHHDPEACAEVAAHGGLGTLMSCLAAHSERLYREGQGVCASSGLSSPGGLLANVAEVGMDDIPGVGLTTTRHGARNRGKSDEHGTSSGDFDAQILALGALINCVELKQCADNCVIMAGLSVLSSFPTALATTGKTISTSKLSTRCAALGFLASLLVTCTEGFAKHLETGDREHGEDGEERMLIGAEAHGARSAISPPRGITKSSALPDTPVKEFATPEVMAGVEAEETMTAAEGAQLVLGGHCALLLGLLVRDHDNNRRVVLSALPGRSATLIVRVLEAFMALQLQAGVLTEEVVLAVQELVEELEGMDALLEEEHEENPFALADDDHTVEPRSPEAKASLNRGRKRPRSSTKPPPPRSVSSPVLGQWAADTGGGDDEDVLEYSLSRAQPKVEQEMGLHSRPPEASENGASKFQQNGQAPSTPTAPRSEVASSSSAKKMILGNKEGVVSLNSWRLSPASSPRSPIASPQAGKVGLKVSSGGVAGTRNWLGASGQRTYGQATWRKPFRALGDVISSAYTGVGSGTVDGDGASFEAGLVRGDAVNTHHGTKRSSVLWSPHRAGGVGPKSGRTYSTGVNSSISERGIQVDSPDKSSQLRSNWSSGDATAGESNTSKPIAGGHELAALQMNPEPLGSQTPPLSPEPERAGAASAYRGVGPRSGAGVVSRGAKQIYPVIAKTAVENERRSNAVDGARPKRRTEPATARVYGRQCNTNGEPWTLKPQARPSQAPQRDVRQAPAGMDMDAQREQARLGSGSRIRDAFEFEVDSE